MEEVIFVYQNFIFLIILTDHEFEMGNIGYIEWVDNEKT